MDAMRLAEGSIFAGRYRVVRRIAQGGMGAVYEVVHLETARHRALKVMLPNLVESNELRERFRLEARVAAQIDSAYIVDVFDAGVDEATNVPFLVMELLRGEELGKRLKRVGRFNEEEAVGYLWQTALALDKTHRAHVVHRDLKPENLFLAEQEGEPTRVKVLDFGVAKFVAEQGTAAHATRSLGTPLYMAPEQLRPRMNVSAATDIFALGMIAFSFLTGKPYWYEEQQVCGNVFAFMSAVLVGPTEPATLRAQRRGVTLPGAFDSWFLQITANEPNQRFSSAITAISALAHALSVATRSPSARGMLPAKADSTTVDLSGHTVVLRQATLVRPAGLERVTLEIGSSSQSVPQDKPAPGFGVARPLGGDESSPDLDVPHTLAAHAAKKGPTLRRIGAGMALAVVSGMGAKIVAAQCTPAPNVAVVGVESFAVGAMHDALEKAKAGTNEAIPEKLSTLSPAAMRPATAEPLSDATTNVPKPEAPETRESLQTSTGKIVADTKINKTNLSTEFTRD